MADLTRTAEQREPAQCPDPGPGRPLGVGRQEAVAGVPNALSRSASYFSGERDLPIVPAMFSPEVSQFRGGANVTLRAAPPASTEERNQPPCTLTREQLSDERED
jgi:hypothetical protein